jgi:sterol-4alpha-carboxylate 3-dehydrogenase (decarboxylating)
LGTEIVSELIADGRYIVYSLDLDIPPEHKQIAGVRSYIQTDITNKDDIIKALEGIDVVFHTAALLPFSIRNIHQAMRVVNVEGSKNIIEACKMKGVKRLIYTSSCSVALSRSKVKSNTKEMDESYPLPKDPLNLYTETKGAAEMMIRKANDVFGLNTCAIRLGGLIGGKKNPMMPFLAASRMCRVGGGNYCMAWTSLETAAKVHLAAERHLTRKPMNWKTNSFNVVSAHVNYRDLIAFCAQENGGKVPYVMPMWLGRLLAEVNHSALRLTGFVPFNEFLNNICLDFFRPSVYSVEHTEQELGWVECRSWQEIVKEVMKEYKSEQCVEKSGIYSSQIDTATPCKKKNK